jgi:hypothetical protein
MSELDAERGHLVQRDALVLEVEALRQRDAQALRAGAGLQQPRRDADRELVRVADAVVAEVAVLGEQLPEVVVVDRRVEHRQRVLLAERDVDVVRARLERVREARAEELPLALEHEAPRRGSRSGSRGCGCGRRDTGSSRS